MEETLRELYIRETSRDNPHLDLPLAAELARPPAVGAGLVDDLSGTPAVGAGGLGGEEIGRAHV